MIQEVRRFLEIFDQDQQEKIDLRFLAATLERLACAYYDLQPDAPPQNAKEPPNKDMGKAARDVVARVFPDFGFYDLSDPLRVGAQSMVGDAIDDLLDIRAEMLETVWRWENNGPQDAVWHFRLSYEGHWGRHLQNLCGYVHALIFEA
jgi:hypothetical protein